MKKKEGGGVVGCYHPKTTLQTFLVTQSTQHLYVVVEFQHFCGLWLSFNTRIRRVVYYPHNSVSVINLRHHICVCFPKILKIR